MKVDREKFVNAVQYLSEINQANFDSLDFSEFFDVTDPEYAQFHEEFKLFGLSNKDFLTMQTDKWIRLENENTFEYPEDPDSEFCEKCLKVLSENEQHIGMCDDCDF